MSLAQPLYCRTSSSAVRHSTRAAVLRDTALHLLTRGKSIHTEAKTNIWQYIYQIRSFANSSITFLINSQAPTPYLKTATNTAPLPIGTGKVIALLTVLAHSWSNITVPLIPGICYRQKWVANFMLHHLMPLKESLLPINKRLGGPQTKSRHFEEILQASPGAQSWNITYSEQIYFPILHCLQVVYHN